ncbi:hypothetical protein [Oceaniglobus ichthyenteri]|uniref:hypothetical protein n=1 Tax=Oceaniglobus ichthyenteri TaxID=2136177 RepID=UPI0013DDACEB|nr:hypothetical protein [Oceaniglobus ichthyenteri]
MNIHWIMRMARWARNPPSAKMVKIVVGVVALCVLLVVIERTLGWPDALTADRLPIRGR